MRTLSIGAVLLLTLAPSLPDTSSKILYQCPHLGEAKLKLDGSVDEPAWQRAKPLTDFGILRTDKIAERKTVARLLWDDTFLYVSFVCANDGIRAKLTARDSPVWEGEAAELFLCPQGADAFYYEIDFNPHNAIYDSRLESWKYQDQVKYGAQWAKGFNARIESAVQIQRDLAGQVTGWSVEAAVPFKDLDVAGARAPAPGAIWLFNVFRVAVKADDSQELSHWQPVKPEFHRPHQFPRLEFVANR